MRSAAELIVVHFPAGAVPSRVTEPGAKALGARAREAIKGTTAPATPLLPAFSSAFTRMAIGTIVALANASAAASLRSVTTSGSVVHGGSVLLCESWGWRESFEG